MNKIYKVIYSETRKAWVVVSELVTGHSKSPGKRAMRMALAAGVLAAVVMLLPKDAEAEEGGIHYYSVNSTDVVRDRVDDTNYNNDGATGGHALAAGQNTLALGTNDVVVGHNSKADGSNNTVIGQSNDVTGSFETRTYTGRARWSGGSDFEEIGTFPFPSDLQSEISYVGSNNSILGQNTSVIGNKNVAIGTDSKVQGGYEERSDYSWKSSGEGKSSPQKCVNRNQVR